MKKQMTKLMVITLALLATVSAEAQRRDSAIQSTVNLIGPRRPVRSNLQMWVVGSSGLSRLTTSEQAPTNTTMELKNHDVYGGGILLEAGRFAMTGQTGVMYFQEGSKLELSTIGSGPSASRTSQVEMGYVGIPAVGRWNALRRGRTRLSFGAGLMPAALVSRNAKNKIETKNATGVVTATEEKDVSGTDGLRAGNVFALGSIGGDIGLNRNQDMRIEVVYRRGLMSVNEGDDGAYTNSVVMNLGFGFDI